MLVLAVLACYGAESPPLCFLLSMLDIRFFSKSGDFFVSEKDYSILLIVTLGATVRLDELRVFV